MRRRPFWPMLLRSPRSTTSSSDARDGGHGLRRDPGRSNRPPRSPSIRPIAPARRDRYSARPMPRPRPPLTQADRLPHRPSRAVSRTMPPCARSRACRQGSRGARRLLRESRAPRCSGPGTAPSRRPRTASMERLKAADEDGLDPADYRRARPWPAPAERRPRMGGGRREALARRDPLRAGRPRRPHRPCPHFGARHAEALGCRRRTRCWRPSPRHRMRAAALECLQSAACRLSRPQGEARRVARKPSLRAERARALGPGTAASACATRACR